ncbi:MAG: metal-dependent transcriptional regulator [Chloroflexi bacterium]|nr:MAG: metal-dependent transcriptional regulator [Chloroflexota bacterium]
MGAAPAGHSSTIEDYVVTVYRMWANGEPVVGARLAEQLGVTPATVTEMVARLRSQGLLTSDRRIELSPAGLRLARNMVSRHRLVERFLVDVLGFGWEEVHAEAHRLEHALSPRVTERLADFLGHPATCPHGHPIMADGAGEPSLELSPLAALEAGDAGTVRRIVQEDTDLLSLLSSLGISLGTPVRVEGVQPYGGPLRVDVDGESRLIGREAAAMVLVER